MISGFGVDHGDISKRGYLKSISDVVNIGAKQAKTLATTKPSARLARKTQLGREHAAREKKLGFASSPETKPMPFHPRARKAWEQGYRNG